MSNAQRNTPPVPRAGTDTTNTVENNVVRVNVAFTRVYHGLKENATIPPVARKKMEISIKQEAPKDSPAKILVTRHKLGTAEKYHVS